MTKNVENKKTKEMPDKSMNILTKYIKQKYAKTNVNAGITK